MHDRLIDGKCGSERTKSIYRVELSGIESIAPLRFILGHHRHYDVKDKPYMVAACLISNADLSRAMEDRNLVAFRKLF